MPVVRPTAARLEDSNVIGGCVQRLEAVFRIDPPPLDALMLNRFKALVFNHFERLLVLLVLASLLFIHSVVDYKVGFLSFYFLPVIAAGFFLGRNSGIWSAVLIASLVVFFQSVSGIAGPPGLRPSALLTLGPWAGFLVLTGYVVGTLAEQKDRSARDLRETYVTMLEVLTFYIEARDQHRGHSYRVAQTARMIGGKLGLGERALEDLRVAGLLHEIGAADPQLQRLFNAHPAVVDSVPVARALQGARALLAEYARYHELVGAEWPVDAIGVSEATKVLAVADAYETLLLATDTHASVSPWSALEEIERGSGRIFGAAAVVALRAVKSRPDDAEQRPALTLVS